MEVKLRNCSIQTIGKSKRLFELKSDFEVVKGHFKHDEAKIVYYLNYEKNNEKTVELRFESLELQLTLDEAEKLKKAFNFRTLNLIDGE